MAVGPKTSEVLTGLGARRHCVFTMASSAPPSDIDSLLRHASWLRALARSLLMDAERAEDVVQQTWLVALEHPPRSHRNLRAWLGAIARNILRQDARSEKRRSVRE
ncbi:MAG: sigma factor [Planctomycetota bacterium]